MPGSTVFLEEQPNGDFVVRRKSIDIRELKGILPIPARALTIEEMATLAAAVKLRASRLAVAKPSSSSA